MDEAGREGEEDSVLVFRFCQDFAQSRMCGRDEPSEACTIIAVKMAEEFYASQLSFHIQPMSQSKSKTGTGPRVLAMALANAILDGNELHAWIMALHRTNSGSSTRFTIPAAIAVCKDAVREVDYHSVFTNRFPSHLSWSLNRAIRWWENEADTRSICFLLIAFGRTVFIAYQPTEKIVGLIDSHSHPPNGAIIAFSHLSRLNQFAGWISSNVFPESIRLSNVEAEYELSVLVPSCFFSDSMAPLKEKTMSPPPPERPPARRSFIFPLPQKSGRYFVPPTFNHIQSSSIFHLFSNPERIPHRVPFTTHKRPRFD